MAAAAQQSDGVILAQDGAILVAAPYAIPTLLLCRRLIGGWWDPSKKVWTWTDTPANRERISRAFPRYPLVETPAAAGEPAQQAAGAAAGATPTPVAAPAATVQPAMEVEPPAGLRLPLWTHQVTMFNHAINTLRAHGAALWAVGMGCGKTYAALALIDKYAEQGDRLFLIVAPQAVLTVWMREIINKMSVDWIVLVLNQKVGTAKDKAALMAEKIELAKMLDKPVVVIVNYDSIWRDGLEAEVLKYEWALVVADEIHRIKAPGGKASTYFKRMAPKARRRLGLSGTPAPHSPLDYYGLFRWLDRRVFGPSFAAFRTLFAIMGGFQRKEVKGYKNLDLMERKLAPYTLRIGREVLDLPDVTNNMLDVEIGAEARRAYTSMDKAFIADVKDGLVTSANALVKLLRLQQIANGWIIPDGQELPCTLDNAKLGVLEELFEGTGDEPIVVFCRFHVDMDRIAALCDTMGKSRMELSGRRNELAQWQDGQAQVLLVQLAAGSVGVDLTRSRYAIFYSLSFSLGEFDQALARVHRPGQNRPVSNYFLLAEKTVDHRIMRALNSRREVVESILEDIRKGQ
jgi:SNF2 family DNA or RNA helicase